MPTKVINVKLVETDSEFLENCASKVTTSNGDEWFYMPLWFKKIRNNVYTEYNYENLPKELIEQIVKTRM